jgi:hypothetical protein
MKNKELLEIYINIKNMLLEDLEFVEKRIKTLSDNDSI